VRIPSAVPQAYAACAHLSLLLLPRRVSASRVLVSLKMIRFLLVHALLESTFGEVSMDTPGYSYCNALHRTESDDTCCEGGDISCGRRLSEEPAFKENLTAHGRSLGHCCDLAAFCECLQNYVAPPPSSPYDATCEPNPFKCDSSIAGDCCTARATDHEERRCRDGWIPIYTGTSCWGDSNEFTCYSPTCSAIPADNCGPNDCYTDADLFFIFIVVPLAVVLIGTLGGVYGCYKGKCCCFTGRREPPRPTPQPGLALPGAALPVIPLAQPIMAQQAQVVAKAV